MVSPCQLVATVWGWWLNTWIICALETLFSLDFMNVVSFPIKKCIISNNFLRHGWDVGNVCV